MKDATMGEDPEFNAIQIFSFIFGVSSLAGLTRLMKSNKELTARTCISAALSTGLYSLGMGMVLYDQFEGHRFALIGLAILSGIGTQTTTEFIWSLAKPVLLSYAESKGGKKN